MRFLIPLALLISCLSESHAEKVWLDGSRWVETLIEEPLNSPHALLILMPGGKGKLHNENFDLSNNFLVRSRKLFSRQNFRVIVFGESSWAPNGYSDSDRINPKHAQDIRDIVVIQNKDHLPVFLIGTSRGTISAAHTGIVMPDLFEGVALTSTVSRNPTFQTIDLRNLENRLLILHHKSDNCVSSPFYGARTLYRSLIPFVSAEFSRIEDGAEVSSDPCRARTFHGFYRVEQKAVDKITAWIEK